MGVQLKSGEIETINFCPQCGSPDLMKTTIGYIHKRYDPNVAKCGCGWYGYTTTQWEELINFYLSLKGSQIQKVERDEP